MNNKGGYAIVPLPITILKDGEGVTLTGAYAELLKAAKSSKPTYIYGFTTDGKAHSATYVDITIDTNKLYIEVGGYVLTITNEDVITWTEAGGGSGDSNTIVLDFSSVEINEDPVEIAGVYETVQDAATDNKLVIVKCVLFTTPIALPLLYSEGSGYTALITDYVGNMYTLSIDGTDYVYIAEGI